MSWVAVAVGVGSAVVGAYGASKQSDAAKKAAQSQAQSASSASQTEKAMLDQQLAASEPFRQNGLTAQTQYMRMLGLNPYNADQAQAQLAVTNPGQAYLQANPDVVADSYWGANPYLHYQTYGRNEGRNWGATTQQQQSLATPQAYDAVGERQKAFDMFRSTPGYQFGMDEGVGAINASATASSGLYSGRAGKALMKFGRDYSDQQGYQPYMNSLASLAGQAQTQTANNASMSMATAGNIANNQMAAGNARASGLMGSANAWNDFYGNTANMAGSMYGSYMQGRK